MTSTKVLDTFALMAYFGDEAGAAFVENLLLESGKGNIKLAISVVNLGEVWYSIVRNASVQEAETYVQNLRSWAIEVVDADWQLTHQAAIYKARGGLSYADCFAAALAKQRNAELITADPEFDRLKDEITIIWAQN
jgi:ribonuclease VapC